MFESVGKNSHSERARRRELGKNLMSFGISFLDDALKGIFRDDLILLGAPSGAGKTQLCCSIAAANLDEGRRVHYIALEAARFEIEHRLKYPLVMDAFYSDPQRPRLGERIGFQDFLCGEWDTELAPYEDAVDSVFQGQYENLFIYYKQNKFGISELIEAVSFAANDTDLIIIDHVHYFDLDHDSENKAMKEIAQTARDLALEQQKPIILVAHLRKRDRGSDELCAGLEEFHGSSDLFKIATRVITMSPGPKTVGGFFETYFRIPKNRLDGEVTRFCAKEFYSSKKGSYEQGKYQLGWAEQKRSRGFEAVDPSLWPSWGKRKAQNGGGHDQNFSGVPPNAQIKGRQKSFDGLSDSDEGHPL